MQVNKVLLLIDQIEERFKSEQDWDNRIKDDCPNSSINGLWNNFYPNMEVLNGHNLKRIDLIEDDFLKLSDFAYQTINKMGYSQLSHFDKKATYKEVLLFFCHLKQTIKLLPFE